MHNYLEKATIFTILGILNIYSIEDIDKKIK